MNNLRKPPNVPSQTAFSLDPKNPSGQAAQDLVFPKLSLQNSDQTSLGYYVKLGKARLRDFWRGCMIFM